MKVIVTGGGGFLGSHIIGELLRQNKEVTSISRKPYPELDSRVIQISCDLGDKEKLVKSITGAQEVYHAAARVGIWGPWKDFYDTNVVGTQNVIEACVKAGCTRLIYTSSPSVVFDGHDHLGVDESYPYVEKRISHYGYSKRLAEEKILSANGKNQLFTVALRPHLIWGKGDRFLLPRVIEQARSGKLRRVGNGKNRVDITHVKDAARAHVLAAERLGGISPCAGKAYFLNQGEPVLLWDFIDEVLRRNQIPSLKKSINFPLAYQLGASLELAYGLFGAKKEPPMTRFLAQTLARNHFYSMDSAKRDFGYAPQVSMTAGLDELYS